MEPKDSAMRIIIIFAFLLSACNESPKNAYWANICVKSETKLQLVILPCAMSMQGFCMGGLRQTWQPRNNCVQYEVRCIVPEKAINKQCPERI